MIDRFELKTALRQAQGSLIPPPMSVELVETRPPGSPATTARFNIPAIED
jgi:hypothetical protein